MSKTLAELSEEGRLLFASGDLKGASKVLSEARLNFKQSNSSERIDQGPDGALCITTIGEDGKGAFKILKQVPVTGESKEYRAEDYRDTSEDNKPAEEVRETEDKKLSENTYGRATTEEDPKKEVGKSLPNIPKR